MGAQYCYPANAMRVCVEQIKQQRILGQVYCPQLDEPISFIDMCDLVLQMEDVFDKRGYPLAFQQKRTFRKSEPRRLKTLVVAPDTVNARIAAYQSIQGGVATFIVYVTSRQNATWQGHIDWLDAGERTFFQSALEFIRQVDCRLVRCDTDGLSEQIAQ